MIRIGTAGWSIPARFRHLFADAPSGLARYAGGFNAAEINSSFYRPHRPQTYERWAASVPDDFRFAVKVPKAITHERRLNDTVDLIAAFLDEIRGLGPKLGPLLVQLPPSFAFEPAVADGFFRDLRARWIGAVACEPRHPTWFEGDAERLLEEHDVARVAADPARVPTAGAPGGARRLAYYRLHGSPRMYYSAYDEHVLRQLAERLRGEGIAEAWCMFDNTVSGAALGDALAVKALLGAR